MKAVAWLLGLLLFTASPAAWSAESIVVQSATASVRGTELNVSARTIFSLNNDVRTALADGATVSLELQAAVDRQRRYWFDATVVDVTLRRELSWNALSNRYVLRDTSNGEQQSFPALDAALIAAGIVQEWQVVDGLRQDADASYVMRVRARIRRGRLPDALLALAFWSEGWNRSSKWSSWMLPR
jgi:Domain of unknown function (DUF4390)